MNRAVSATAGAGSPRRGARSRSVLAAEGAGNSRPDLPCRSPESARRRSAPAPEGEGVPRVDDGPVGGEHRRLADQRDPEHASGVLPPRPLELLRPAGGLHRDEGGGEVRARRGQAAGGETRDARQREDVWPFPVAARGVRRGRVSERALDAGSGGELQSENGALLEELLDDRCKLRDRKAEAGWWRAEAETRSLR